MFPNVRLRRRGLREAADVVRSGAGDQSGMFSVIGFYKKEFQQGAPRLDCGDEKPKREVGQAFSGFQPVRVDHIRTG